MKKLLMALLALVATQVQSQNFEGSIAWSMKMEITDPKLKAQMAEGQQKMNDPATQAKMKELQEKMKDPQFKAMMENNPQMKAMMEKMTQGGGDMMSNMMPKGMIVRMKDGNSLVTMDGGMMAGDFLHLKDKNESVKLDRENKTYWVMPSGNEPGKTEGAKPTITKTSETMKVMGYTCTKYVAVMSEHGQTLTTNMWTTTEIKDIDPKAFAKQRMGKGQSMFYEGMDGMPLRIESITPQGNMVMEVTDIKRGGQNAADFTIPSDYKETKGMLGR
ncbi:MAG: DUF4412 domain-containing protein [Bacteroidetes bacterium]|nr:DUF4412 domain-containing protein [Bacteroidota bacterium]MBI3483029.1 DUF4412 domain-containing protein [Bacteroidota bacterium]